MSKDWPSMDDDHMKLGENDLMPAKDGWWKNPYTGEMMDPEGNIYDERGQKIIDED